MVSRDLLIVEVYQKSTIGIRFYSEKQRRLGKKFFKEKGIKVFLFSKKIIISIGVLRRYQEKIQTRKVRCNSFYMKPFFDFSNDLKTGQVK